METLASVNPELEWIFDSLDGVRRARYLALASLALLCYEYVLTFDQEVRIYKHYTLISLVLILLFLVSLQLEYFWSGAWTKTRALFLAVCTKYT